MNGYPESPGPAVSEAACAAVGAAYDSLPETTCDRRAACCALLPGLGPAEAVYLARAWSSWDAGRRLAAYRKLVAYFLTNAVRVSGCPFLEDGLCSVYAHRPFGCRAYGLWSPSAYRRQAREAAAAAERVRAAWAGMGVTLPEAVAGRQPAYCRAVRLVNGQIDDKGLREAGERLREADRALGDWGRSYLSACQGDLSHLAAVQTFGGQEALRYKVTVVREWIADGKSPSLNYLIDRLADGSGRTLLP